MADHRVSAGASLPAQPNLEFYRRRAKSLLKAAKAGDPAALARFQIHHFTPGDLQLSAAQLVIARESGFDSWAKLKRHIEAALRANGERLRPLTRDFSYYEGRAEGFLQAHRGGMRHTAEVIRRYHPAFAGATEPEMAADFTLNDARLIQARQHGFENWAQFQSYIESLAEDDRQEPFLRAVDALKAGELDHLRALLRQEPDLARLSGSNGNTLLSLAVSERRPEAYRLLLESGADPNGGNNYGWTPLHQAAGGGDMEAARCLLEAGASPTMSARGEGGTPLVQALFWGHRRMADFLAGYGIAPINLRVAAGLGRLDLLQQFFSPGGELLPQAGQQREFYRPHGAFPEWTPTESAQEILDEALSYAARNGRDEVLSFLLERGADINSVPYNGSPLSWAAFTNRFSTVRWLVEHGAEVNQRLKFGGRDHGNGITALHIPAQNGQMDMVRLLVELGADPGVLDNLYLSSPAGWAAYGGHAEVAEFLVSLPQTGILNLAAFGRVERLRQLLDEDPGLGAGPAEERRVRPLHKAVQGGHIEAVRLLLERGADASLPTAAGRTALQMAEESGNAEIVALLRGEG